MTQADPDYDLAVPNAAALVESLRAVGYSLPTAIADILDNSISAKARNIWIDFHWDGFRSSVSILDDGTGMDEKALIEAMRPGTVNPTATRSASDLGRFGLGLKTASFSQCRVLTVWSKTSSTPIAGRRWDLDHVVRKNEWRLLKDLGDTHAPSLTRLKQQQQGTLVIWSSMDRLSGTDNVGDSAAHRRFHEHIRDVRQYLEMIFHRHLAGAARNHVGPLKIFVNETPLSPWDPFQVSATNPAYQSPVEEIESNGNVVRVRGVVLPHKDRLSRAEYDRGGGPRGWLAQQGYYIYRNDRIIIAGDWLQLGTGERPWPKEEQFKLARMSVDIGNKEDLEWSLDVKKSTARPPAAIRERLAGLAEGWRRKARDVFVHRGSYGPRPPVGAVIERPWTSAVRNDRLTYRINRQHPMVDGVLTRLGPLKPDVDSVLRLIEETVPVQKIWIDLADQDNEPAIPYEDVPESQVRADIRTTYQILLDRNLGHETALACLRASEPFNRFPELIEELNRS